MKKLIVSITLGLLLVGCGNQAAAISKPNDVLIKVGNESITSGQVYGLMVSTDATSVLKQQATQIILNKIVGLSDELKAKADEELVSFTESVGDSLAMYLEYYGYKDTEDYLNNGIIPTLQQEELVKQYITTNFDALVAGYRPKMVRLIEITDATIAETALAELKAGKDFSEVADLYSTSNYPGDEELVNNTSSLPKVVIDYYDYQTTPSLSKVLTDGTTNFIVQVTEADTNKLTDEIIENFTMDTTFMEKTLEYYFVENGFTIYDKPLYDLFVQSYPNYLGK